MIVSINKNTKCSGERYNFKIGMERCEKRDKCPLYDSKIYDNDLRFDTIQEFRRCQLDKLDFTQNKTH